LYVQGKGVPQDYTTARQWFEKAAAQGHAWAQFFLGVLYAEGRGVLQDYGTARQWYERAAAQGEAMAQFNLGLLYAEGRGVPQNSVHAWMWYSLAAAHSTDDQPKLAADPRDEITRRMTPAQIAEAQRLANQCEARQFKGCRGEKTIESTR
jgi:TPR repeat protein